MKLYRRITWMLAMMLADGVIDQRERAMISRICQTRTFIGKQEIKRTINSLQAQANPVEYAINNSAIPNNLTLLKCLINIAAADGKISDEEIDLLQKVAAKMNVQPNILRDMINAAYADYWNNKKKTLTLRCRDSFC